MSSCQDIQDSINNPVSFGGGSGGTDTNAIHKNVANEITAITEKTIPVANDVVIIEDSAASFVKKRVKISNLPGTDPTAIHDDVANEITAITEKTIPVANDLFIIEDSAAAGVKKKLKFSNLIAGKLSLDQTTPETIINGIPLLDATRTITLAHQLVDKEYVDQAVSFVADFYFNNTASSIGGIYFKMLELPTGEAESTFTTAGLGLGNDQALVNFATDAGIPGIDTLQAGVYSAHIHVAKTVGTRAAQVYYAIYTRDLGGTETLRATSEVSDTFTTKTDLDLHATIAADIDILVTDRIIIKWFANITGAGTSATVVLYAEGTNSSHLSIPTSIEVLNSVFVRKDLYDANSILIATANDTPIVLPIAASTIVGRKATGDIVALSVADLNTLLSLPALDSYSSTEVATNKTWIDGKVIYRKVITTGALPNNTTKNTAHGLSGQTWITCFTGTARDGSNFYIQLPFFQTTSVNGLRVTIDATNISFFSATNLSTFTTSYIILEYTK
jgi:hypothetical protein